MTKILPLIRENCDYFNPFSHNPTKWSNTLQQLVGNLTTNCLSVFDHFVGLALKGFKFNFGLFWLSCDSNIETSSCRVWAKLQLSIARPHFLKHITQSSIKKTIAAKCAWNYAWLVFWYLNKISRKRRHWFKVHYSSIYI